jgi:hypothetical protein
MTFNVRPTVLVGFSDPPDRLNSAMSTVTSEGSSAVFDTLALALTAPAPPDRRQLIVLFSDGVDTSSITDPARLLDLVHRTTPTVAVVLAATPASTSVFRAPTSVVGPAFRRVYDRLAAETGGLVVPVEPGDSLSTRFRRVLDEFRSSYVLHFVPQGVERSGFHKLTVRVRRQDGLELRARAGYRWR